MREVAPARVRSRTSGGATSLSGGRNRPPDGGTASRPASCASERPVSVPLGKEEQDVIPRTRVNRRARALSGDASRSRLRLQEGCSYSFMGTTLDVDDDLLARAVRPTGITAEPELIRLGFEALIARESGRRLARLVQTGRNPSLVLTAASPERGTPFTTLWSWRRRAERRAVDSREAGALDWH